MPMGPWLRPARLGWSRGCRNLRGTPLGGLGRSRSPYAITVSTVETGCSLNRARLTDEVNMMAQHCPLITILP